MAAPDSGAGKNPNNLYIFWKLVLDKVVQMFYTMQTNVVQTF
jgi:hypothetical protein